MSQKDADGVSMATSLAAPQFSPNAVYLANALPESSLSPPSIQSVQVRPPSPLLLWSLSVPPHFPEGAFISILSFDASVDKMNQQRAECIADGLFDTNIFVSVVHCPKCLCRITHNKIIEKVLSIDIVLGETLHVVMHLSTRH